MKKTSDAIVICPLNNEFKILLIRRKNPPFKGEYAFPGGFIDNGEDPLSACIRELFEETDLTLSPEDSIELSVRKKDGRDPRGKTQTHPYLFILKKEMPVIAKDDAMSVEWVFVKDIKKLAFDHGAILCEALGKFWPYMPGNIRNETNIDKEVVFFGGSFNPWHAGHEECIRLFTENYPDKILVVLPDTNPWKDIESRDEKYCYFESFKELENKLKNYKISIYPGFWGMEKHNATYDWFKDVDASKRGLLVGDDQFTNLKNWKNADKLLKFMDFLFVVPRNLKDNERDKLRCEVLHMACDLEINILSDHDYRHISSTDIRAKNGNKG